MGKEKMKDYYLGICLCVGVLVGILFDILPLSLAIALILGTALDKRKSREKKEKQ